MTRANAETGNLKQQVAAATDRIASLEAVLKTAKDATAAAEQERTAADAARAEAAQTAAQAEEACETARAETVRLQTKVRQQMTALDAAEEETSVLRRRLAEKHALEAEVGTRLARQEEATAALLQQVAAAQEQLAMPCETCKSYEQQLQRLHANQARATAQAEEAEAEAAEGRDQRARLQSQLESQVRHVHRAGKGHKSCAERVLRHSVDANMGKFCLPLPASL